MITEVIFDIETKKLFQDIEAFDPAALGVSIVSLYKRQLDDAGHEIKGEMFSFWDDELKNAWTHFSNVDRIIGYNSLKFDVPALIPLCPYDFKKLPHFDMLDLIKQQLGFRLSLRVVAENTIGHTKSDVGTYAVVYLNEHSPESLKKLKDYCEMDVIVTKEVYDYGKKFGHLKYKDRWNTPRQVDINFSYPPPANSHQIGLF